MFKAATRYVITQINAGGGWNGEPVQLVEYYNQGGPTGRRTRSRRRWPMACS